MNQGKFVSPPDQVEAANQKDGGKYPKGAE